MIVDTHLHLIDQSTLRYPWLADAGSLNRDHPYSEYAHQANRSGIGQVLHMEVDVDSAQMETETAFVAGLSRQPGNMLRGAIAACRPESPDFAAYLERQTSNPLVKGFRRVLHVMPDETSQSDVYRNNIRRLAGTGLTYDLIFKGDKLANAIALADAAPDVQFVLDHFGSPDLKRGKDQPWWNLIADLGKRPNVVAKISGIIAYTDPDGWTVESLRPFFERVIQSFGWDRAVWGSDWPVCNLGGGLTQWVAATHALLAGASDSERGKLLSANARLIWKLPHMPM
jgi:predicted TIM-barrel fold metal-dependent hydrolase